MSRKNQLMLAVLAIDPDAYGDYKAVDGVMSYTYHASGGQPSSWYPCEMEALEAYARELQSEAEEQDRKSSEDIRLISEALSLPK